MKFFLRTSLLLTSCSCLQVVERSEHNVVRRGEEAVIFCLADQDVDSCSWYPPSGRKCGPLNTNQRMCRTYDNIHFNGSASNCQILVKDLKDEQNGDWTCSLTKDGDQQVNSTVELMEAFPANLEWDDDIFGTFYLKTGDPKTVNCKASHVRPLGKFYYHFGEDHLTNQLPSESQQITSTGDSKISNSSLALTLQPEPEYNDQKLYCTYVQEDGTGKELFKQSISLDLKVHYLAKSVDNVVVPPAKSGENFNISLKFNALPRPAEEDISWEVRREEDTLTINLDPESVRVEKNYLVYPLEQVSQYQYRARMTILNISDAENNLDHALVISNRFSNSREPLVIEQLFHIQVDRAQIAVEGSTSMTTLIIVIVLMVIIAGIVASMTVVWAKNKGRLCYSNNTRPYINPDVTAQKEPMVKHHPFGRPAET